MRIKTCLAAVRRAAVLLRAAGRLGSAIARAKL